MAILNPEHLFDQASRLILPPPAGAPRQVDLRRAVSSAYYGLFHALLAEAADLVIGSTARSSAEYALVYRSIDHKSAHTLCEQATKSPANEKYQRYMPTGGFDGGIRAFAATFIELYEKRHGADYDPLVRFKTSDVILAINKGRTALSRLGDAPDRHRDTFLILLMFPPRR